MGGRVDVVAAVIIRDGRVLLTRRPQGSHLAGHWEFPGGKVEDGEDDASALTRELREEIGVEVVVGELFERIVHAYPERTVELRFYRCRIRAGEPRALEVAAIAWVDAAGLGEARLPPADAPLVGRLAAELG